MTRPWRAALLVAWCALTGAAVAWKIDHQLPAVRDDVAELGPRAHP